eukprot:gene8676-623_t
MRSKQMKEKKVAVGGESGGLMKTYFGKDDAPGIQVGPMTVLVGSLIFIFVVIILHFYGRFFR